MGGGDSNCQSSLYTAVVVLLSLPYLPHLAVINSCLFADTLIQLVRNACPHLCPNFAGLQLPGR